MQAAEAFYDALGGLAIFEGQTAQTVTNRPLASLLYAGQALQRAPAFVRSMARRVIERRAREQGCRQITVEMVQGSARRMGR